MFEPKELKKTKRTFDESIDDYAWKSAKGQLDDPEQREISENVIRWAAAQYREQGGDVEKAIRKRRSSIRVKFEAVAIDHHHRTGTLLFADHRKEADKAVDAIVRIAAEECT
ncbi:hypothetical protein ACFYTQ_13560 [Nocardia sp. NPDC004068]|uniref:hypothetical protein n=1 Tax=Nocardia sp. NPDC004068 TaxID=3364303 RepID=UPI00367F74D0